MLYQSKFCLLNFATSTSFTNPWHPYNPNLSKHLEGARSRAFSCLSTFTPKVCGRRMLCVRAPTCIVLRTIDHLR